MVKKCAITIYCFLVFFFGLLFSVSLKAQEIKVFQLGDFDLRGPVKSCLVITDYGKEEYDFNEEGALTKAVTRYSDGDYDVTLYKLAGRELLEKRVENYRDGVFVKNTSIANFYELDTTESKKITEKIVSYNKEFLDQYEYYFGEDGRLVSIKRTNDNGIDETHIKYELYKGEFTETYYLNDVILKSVRTSKIKGEGGEMRKLVLTKEFLEGEPQKALEQVFGGDDKLVSEKKFVYDDKKEAFVTVESVDYTYNEKGVLASSRTKTEKYERVQEYIYQYDSTESENWIKQIVTPDNSYKTRKIKYYPKEEALGEKS